MESVSKCDLLKEIEISETTQVTKEILEKIVNALLPLPIDNIMVVGGRSCEMLTDSICTTLGIQKTKVRLSNFSNTETNVRLDESVRGKDIFIVQTGAPFQGRSVNDHVMELFLLQDACHRSSAKSITVITPFFPYCRSDKKDSRGPISSKMIMDIICQTANRIVCTDLHASQIQAFASIPCDNLYCIKIFCEYIKSNIFESGKNPNQKYVLISPDTGGEKRIRSYSTILELTCCTMTKQRDYSVENSVLESHLSGNPQFVLNKTAIIVDDMIDTAGTMIQGIIELKKYGVKNIIIIASHGVLSGPAIDRINECEDILNVIVTNSIPQEENVRRCPKLIVLDLGPYLANVITRLINGISVSALF